MTFSIRIRRFAFVAMVAMSMVLPAKADRQGVLEGGVYTVKVPDGASWTLNADDVTALGVSNKLVLEKSGSEAAGTGRLIIAQDMATAGWEGEIDVRAGFLNVGAVGALGKSVGSVSVADTATLELNASNIKDKTISFGGTGCGGVGAFYVANGATAHQYALGSCTVTLRSDTTFGSVGTAQQDIRGGTFDMQSHNVRFNGNFIFVSGMVKNMGNVYATVCTGFEAGSYSAPAGKTLSDDVTITIADGGKLYLKALAKIPMKLVAEGALQLNPYGNYSNSGDSYVHDWTGDATFGGNVTRTSDTWFYGTVKFSGRVTASGNFKVGRGGLTLAGNGYVSTADDSFVGTLRADDNFARIGRITLGSGTTWSNGSGKNLYVGCQNLSNSGNYRGVLEVLDGGAMTNKLRIGTDQRSGGTGAVYMRGGSLYVPSGVNLGHRCEAFVEQDGGSLVFNDWVKLPYGGYGNGSDALAVLTLKSGMVKQLVQAICVGHSGGRGEIHVSGGELLANGDNAGVMLVAELWGYSNGHAKGVLTVDGGKADVTTLQMGDSNNCEAMLNVNSGKLTVGSLQVVTNKSIVFSQPVGAYNTEFSNNPCYLNFNGGTIAAKRTCEWLPSTLSRITVYEKGGTFEVPASVTASVTAPICAPSGNGVAAVDFSSDTAWEYVGAPFVDITGDGSGATAHANFDTVSGKLTGITVTSPGCGYMAATATVYAAGSKASVTIKDLPLSTFAGGGITKTGAGTLKLCCANSYAGATVVSNGMLLASVPGAIPDGRNVEISGGGTLNLNGSALTANRLSGTGGTIVGDVTVTGEFCTDFLTRNATTGAPIEIQGRLVFAPGAKVVLANSQALTKDDGKYIALTATGGISGSPTVAVEEGSNVRVSISEDTIKIGYANGFLLIFR